jgi:hypothetical protein
MWALVEGIRRRIGGVAGRGILLAVVCVQAGCESMVTRQYRHEVEDLSNADRIEVTFAYRPDKVSGTLQLPGAVTITDKRRVTAAAAFARRYRDGWRNALSGSGETDVAFYEGERLLGKIQLFSSGITHEGHVRSLTPAEVAELVGLLGIDSQFTQSR